MHLLPYSADVFLLGYSVSCDFFFLSSLNFSRRVGVNTSSIVSQMSLI